MGSVKEGAACRPQQNHNFENCNLLAGPNSTWGAGRRGPTDQSFRRKLERNVSSAKGKTKAIMTLFLSFYISQKIF